jgi:hypothetical protein
MSNRQAKKIAYKMAMCCFDGTLFFKSFPKIKQKDRYRFAKDYAMVYRRLRDAPKMSWDQFSKTY